MQKVAMIGAGSWGTAAAALAAHNVDTTLWARRPEVANSIVATGRNPDYLSDYELPSRLAATADMSEALKGAEAVGMAVPSHGFREIFSTVAPLISPEIPVISLTKGIEQGSLATMTQVIAEVDPNRRPETVAILTGPNLAAEISQQQPTAAVVAATDPSVARVLQAVFMGPTFRVYTNDDVVGCELAGALKNVMAIAAGMSDGMGFGDNTRATLITRALAELTRLGVAMGGQASTFAGLAGMGDLIATCNSSKSRNHRVGAGLARGLTLQEISDEMKMVAEGVKTTKAVIDLSTSYGIEMPIATHVGRVLYDGLDPKEAVLRLMTREAKPE